MTLQTPPPIKKVNCLHFFPTEECVLNFVLPELVEKYVKYLELNKKSQEVSLSDTEFWLSKNILISS